MHRKGRISTTLDTSVRKRESEVIFNKSVRTPSRKDKRCLKERSLPFQTRFSRSWKFWRFFRQQTISYASNKERKSRTEKRKRDDETNAREETERFFVALIIRDTSHISPPTFNLLFDFFFLILFTLESWLIPIALASISLLRKLPLLYQDSDESSDYVISQGSRGDSRWQMSEDSLYIFMRVIAYACMRDTIWGKHDMFLSFFPEFLFCHSK